MKPSLIKALEALAAGELHVRLDAEGLEAEQAALAAAFNQAAAVVERRLGARQRFLARMSQEIRGPVEGVVGTTNLLLETELSDEQRDHAETIRQSTDRLLTIINDIIDYSRIDAGTLTLEHVDFDLRVMVAGILDALSARARAKGLELSGTVEAEVPSLVRGDPGRLRQVLSGLVEGRIEHTTQGRVVMRVSLAEESAQSATVRFEVSDTGDTGDGRADEQLAQPFAADGSSLPGDGAALGLTIAARLVELMGGELGAAGDDGAGLWFTARLQRQPPAAAGAEPADDIAGQRVLLVGASGSGRAALARQLEGWGCSLDGVASARECLDRLREAVAGGAPYDVVLIETLGSSLDAEELGGAVKGELGIADTALVMLASAGQRGDAARLRTLGFEAFFTKPVEASQLHAGLLAVARRRRGRDRASSGIITRHTLAEERKRRVRILLVEHNHINRKVALEALLRLGYRADAVCTGQEALAALRTTAYEILLLDQELTDPSGEQVVRVIRDPGSDVLDHNIPVVALTEKAAARERCLDRGMDDQVTKPVHPRLLQEAIERQLPEEARPGGAAEPAPGHSVVLDRVKLLERLSGDELLCDEVLGEFLGAAPQLVASLRAALEARDAATLERQAYTLKGAAANVSAEAIRALAHKVEGAAREGALGGAEPLIQQLEHELARLEHALGGS